MRRPLAVVALFALPDRAFDARQNVADVVAKADVEHPIDFIEHDEAHVAEIDDAAIEQIDHPAGRADENFRAVPQKFHLGHDLLPAVNGDGADGRELPDPLDLRFHLHRQLTRRDENNRLRGQALGCHLQHRDAERGRLPRARARLPENVDARERARDQQRLNLGRRDVF